MIWTPRPAIGLIYQISGEKIEKVYIGSTEKPIQRFSAHLSGEGCSSEVVDAVFAVGETLTFTILEDEVPRSHLIARERFYQLKKFKENPEGVVHSFLSREVNEYQKSKLGDAYTKYKRPTGIPPCDMMTVAQMRHEAKRRWEDERPAREQAERLHQEYLEQCAKRSGRVHIVYGEREIVIELPNNARWGQWSRSEYAKRCPEIFEKADADLLRFNRASNPTGGAL